MAASGREATLRLHQGAMTRINIIFIGILCLIPCFRPRIIYLSGSEQGEFLIRLWLLVSFAVCLVVWVRARFPHKGIVSAVFGLVIAVAISTVICKGDLWVWYDLWFPSCCVAMFVSGFSRFRDELLISIYMVTSTLSFLNLASMILYPGGIVQNSVYFFGNRNAAYQVVLPSVASAMLIEYQRRTPLPLLSMFSSIIGLLQFAIGGSVTSLVAYLFFFTLLIIFANRKIRVLLSSYILVILSIAGTIGLVFFHVHEVFAPLIEGVFHKSLTLSGRTQLWDKVISLIDCEHLLLGRGASGYRDINVDGVQFYHTHNLYLETWFDAGVVGIALLLVLLLACCYALRKLRSCRQAVILVSIFGAYLMIGMVENILTSSFFMLLILCCVHLGETTGSRGGVGGKCKVVQL